VQIWNVKLAILAIGFSGAAVFGGCQQANSNYAEGCSARLPGWGGPSDGIGHLRPVLPVFLDASGSTHWGEIHTAGPVRSASTTISDETLRRHMTMVSDLNPLPHLVLEVAPEASCKRVRAVRRIIDNAPLCKESQLCSEGADWKIWPFAGGP
jgi:hypothetical protein